MYWLETYALVGGVVFAASGAVLLALLAWTAAKEYAAAQFRIHRRLASFITIRDTPGMDGRVPAASFKVH
jgi:membrane protein required for beta-lactamase induction